MKISLSEAEHKSAVAFWLREKHPTLLSDGVEISEMAVTTYPPGVDLTIKPISIQIDPFSASSEPSNG